MSFVHQTHILKRLIHLRGQNAEVFRPKENEFHEPDGQCQVGQYRGLFHEANGYLRTLTGEAGKTYTAKQPMFLTLYTDQLRKEDLMEIKGTRYRIIGLDNLGNLHIFLDISLEVV